jgi:predicted sulfurtransferase
MYPLSNKGLLSNTRGADDMKRLTYISFMFFLFMSCVAQAQSESQNAVRVGDKIVTEARKGGYQLITPEKLKKEYLKDPAAFLLVDTRQEWAYQMQHIKGAVHIDFTPTWWNQYSPVTRSEMKKLLGPDKNKKVVFY